MALAHLFTALGLALSAPGSAADGGGRMAMPSGNVFEPLLADVKTPQSMASLLWGRSATRSTAVGAVAFGDDIGLVRWPGGASTTRARTSGTSTSSRNGHAA